ncbi:MAG: AbrB family transcriptional regulator [Planctomycetota bacterium]|jgi:membrane AbrB-like protein|nr:AbrB family transcriptional regulator [Planctomycetota bacterium]MDR1520125.1 AbrB family transcriptional regulator [Planctomycetota bacterium]
MKFLERLDFSRLPARLRWALLAGLTLIFSFILVSLRLPAGILMGAMGAAIVMALAEGQIQTPGIAFSLAQGMVGCLVAGSISPATLDTIGRNWPFFISMVLSVSAISTFLGWLLARTRILPGSTAIWGTSPGAALLMTLMSENFGADSRLVAFMQYLRVLTVTLFATTLPLVWDIAIAASPPERAAEIFDPGSIFLALGLAVAGTFLRGLCHFPSGPMLLPILVLPFLAAAGLGPLRLPWQLYAASYCVVGWNVGMRFTRSIVSYALHAFSRILATILAMIAACGILAWIFVAAAGIDPLTALLASCPGGMDTVAIITASIGGDVPLVMAVQTGRFIFVLLTGPAVAAFISKRLEGTARGETTA